MSLNPYSLVCGYCGLSMGMLGNFEEGKTYLEKGLGNASDINDLATLGMFELQYGLFFTARGDWEPAIEHFQKCIKYSEEGKWVLGCALSWSSLGSACSMLGDPETGRRHAEKGLKMHRDTGIEMLLSMHHLWLGSIHLDLGDLKNAQSLMEEALRLSQKNNEKLFEGCSWMWLGRISGKTEPLQIDKAEECILKGIEICKELKIKIYYSLGYLFLGEFYQNTGEKEKAKNTLKKGEGMFQDMGMDYWLARTYAVYAELYKKEGEALKAKGNLNKAIEILKECGADGWVEKYEKELASLS